MRRQFTPMLLAAVLAASSAQAQEARSTAAPHATPSVVAADLPFGTGYEARQRQAEQARAAQEQQDRARDETRVRTQDEAQARARDQAQARDRDQAATDGTAVQTRTERGTRERSNSTKESRRTDRDQRTQRGPRH